MAERSPSSGGDLYSKRVLSAPCSNPALPSWLSHPSWRVGLVTQECLRGLGTHPRDSLNCFFQTHAECLPSGTPTPSALVALFSSLPWFLIQGGGLQGSQGAKCLLLRALISREAVSRDSQPHDSSSRDFTRYPQSGLSSQAGTCALAFPSCMRPHGTREC